MRLTLYAVLMVCLAIAAEGDSKWQEKIKWQIPKKLAIWRRYGNSDVAKWLYNFLKSEYSGREWHVVVYNPLYGGDKHWVKFCGGYHTFRKHGRNVAVASVESGKTTPIKAGTTNKLKAVKTKYCKKVWWGKTKCHYLTAKQIYYDTLPKEFAHGCTYASAGVIKRNANIAHKAPANRLAKTDNGYFQLYVFG